MSPKKADLKETIDEEVENLIPNSEIPLNELPESLRLGILESSGLKEGQLSELYLVIMYNKSSLRYAIFLRQQGYLDAYTVSDKLIKEISFWLLKP